MNIMMIVRDVIVNHASSVRTISIYGRKALLGNMMMVSGKKYSVLTNVPMEHICVVITAENV